MLRSITKFSLDYELFAHLLSQRSNITIPILKCLYMNNERLWLHYQLRSWTYHHHIFEHITLQSTLIYHRSSFILLLNYLIWNSLLKRRIIIHLTTIHQLINHYQFLFFLNIDIKKKKTTKTKALRYYEICNVPS